MWQEDRQPNETRTQRKGNHQVPKVRSSASRGRHRHQQSRFPHRSQSKAKKWQRNHPPSDYDGTFAVASGSSTVNHWPDRSRVFSPPLRGPIPAQERPADSRPITADSISKLLAPMTGSSSRLSPKASPTDEALHVPGCIANTQQYSSPELVIGSRRHNEDQHTPWELLPPRFAGRGSHNPGGSATSTSHNKPECLKSKLLGILSGDAPPANQNISTRPRPDKQKESEAQLVYTAFPQNARGEKVVEQDLDAIIDLTLDNSDDEYLDTSDQRLPSRGSGSAQGALTSPAPKSYLPPGGATGNYSARGFSTSSTILSPPLNLAREPHDKPRLFVRYALDSWPCLANISAHGFVDQICVSPQWGREVIRSPDDPTLEFIHSACVLNAYGSALLVLAHAREGFPVTIHRLGERSPIRLIGSHERPAVPGKPHGLTAICSMMQPFSFATGGADHAIHIWNIDHNLQTTRSTSPLAIRHTSRIHSLLPIVDSSHKLASSGADCNLNVYDLPSERVVNMVKLSNPGYHIHHSGNPSTLLIQTAHREHQFEICDLRVGSINETQTFGFASDNLRLSRFARGDVAHSTLFACGDLDGHVHIWDLRNAKQPATQVKCFQTRINNVIWHESHLLASSYDNKIAAISYTYTNSVIQTA